MTYKQKYPLRTYLGKYEKWVLVLYGSQRMRSADNELERFFAMFPGRQWLEDFNSVDITDYVQVMRSREVTEESISRRLSAIRVFWKWLIEDQGLFLQNPVNAFRRLKPWSPQRKEISLLQVQRLLNECASIQDKKIVLSVICGDERPGGNAYKRIRNAAERAGIKNFRLKQLRGLASKRMRDDIVKLHCQQILNTLAAESQENRNALATVKSPSLDEGTSVLHSDNDLPASDGVK